MDEPKLGQVVEAKIVGTIMGVEQIMGGKRYKVATPDGFFSYVSDSQVAVVLSP
jgi:hypothetical protein